MGAVVMGVDVGQRHDPTAIAVVEMEPRDRPAGGREFHYLTRYLERLTLGTAYPEVATRLASIAAGVGSRAGAWPRLYLDATGVGTPVLDELRRANVRAKLLPVFFTHGDRRTMHDNGEISLGKAWLVSRMQALLQASRLHLPQTDEARVLAMELMDYEIRIDANANDTYGAFKVGAHDDLVTAIGLATQDEGSGIPYALWEEDGWSEPATRGRQQDADEPAQPEPEPHPESREHVRKSVWPNQDNRQEPDDVRPPSEPRAQVETREQVRRGVFETHDGQQRYSR